MRFFKNALLISFLAIKTIIGMTMEELLEGASVTRLHVNNNDSINFMGSTYKTLAKVLKNTDNGQEVIGYYISSCYYNNNFEPFYNGDIEKDNNGWQRITLYSLVFNTLGSPINNTSGNNKLFNLQQFHNNNISPNVQDGDSEFFMVSQNPLEPHPEEKFFHVLVLNQN